MNEESETVGDALASLAITIIHNLELAVPVVMAAGALTVVAWLKRKKRIVDAVKAEAIEAEKEFGDGHGPQKRERVQKRVREKYMTFNTTINRHIEDHGMPAVEEYRASLPPEEPK